MNQAFEVTNRAPLAKGNRKLRARMLTQQDARAKRLAPNLAKAADELFASTVRREKAALATKAILVADVLPAAPPPDITFVLNPPMVY